MNKLVFYFKKTYLYIFCSAFLAVYYFSSAQVEYSKALIFPKFIMTVFAALILWNWIDAFIKARKVWNEEYADKGQSDETAKTNLACFWKKNKKEIVVFISALVFILVSQVVGFYVCTCVYIFGVMYYLGIRKLYVALPIAVIATVVLYFAFSVYLGVRLPTGFLI